MILGIGADLCRIERVRRSVNHFGRAWLEELFTPGEQAWCSLTLDPGLAFAQLFCCKEACAKALGTGFSSKVSAQDIELTPEMAVVLHRGALVRVKRLAPANCSLEFFVSNSSTDHFAMSFVLLQALTDGRPLRASGWVFGVSDRLIRDIRVKGGYGI
jgi:holo-[acyl-carrier protein] synthase